MPECSPGDRVVVHLKEGRIISVYEVEWDERHIFEIISLYDSGYIIYVPQAMVLKEAFALTKWNYKLYNVEAKFIDSNVCHINEHKIMSIYSKMDGMTCSRCGEFACKASPNQQDKSFICYLCRFNRFR